MIQKLICTSCYYYSTPDRSRSEHSILTTVFYTGLGTRSSDGSDGTSTSETSKTSMFYLIRTSNLKFLSSNKVLKFFLRYNLSYILVFNIDVFRIDVLVTLMFFFFNVWKSMFLFFVIAHWSHLIFFSSPRKFLLIGRCYCTWVMIV